MNDGDAYSWLVMPNGKAVLPVEFGHVQGMACRCKPQLVDGIVIHNAFDEREKSESDGRIVQQ